MDPATRVVVPDNGGILITGTNTFTVEQGTFFFLPLFNATDSPPIAGVFPTTPAQAGPYFFDPEQGGAQGFEVVVDGKVTPIGPSFIVGPVTTPPLLDGGGTHIITLGVFLTPLSRGTHTITIRGGLFGPIVAETYGIDSISEEFTYTVHVVRRS